MRLDGKIWLGPPFAFLDLISRSVPWFCHLLDSASCTPRISTCDRKKSETKPTCRHVCCPPHCYIDGLRCICVRPSRLSGSKKSSSCKSLKSDKRISRRIWRNRCGGIWKSKCLKTVDHRGLGRFMVVERKNVGAKTWSWMVTQEEESWAVHPFNARIWRSFFDCCCMHSTFSRRSRMASSNSVIDWIVVRQVCFVIAVFYYMPLWPFILRRAGTFAALLKFHSGFVKFTSLAIWTMTNLSLF